MTSSLPDSKVLSNLEALAATANSYASSYGLLVERNGHFQAAPMSLLPNVFPATAFEKAKSLAPLWNLLVDRLSRDVDFLTETLGGDVSDADPYTAQLLKMYLKLYSPGSSSLAQQADRFNIHRGDYMLHPSNSSGNHEARNLASSSSSSSSPALSSTMFSLKQIELNTIAASFASLACRTAQLHRHLTARFDCEEFLKNNERKVLGGCSAESDAHNDAARGVPDNPTLQALPLAMKLTVNRYRYRFDLKEETTCVVLFVVQPGETNTVDQRTLEFELYDRHGIPVVRMSLAECLSKVRVDDRSGALRLADDDDHREVALVYYRAGYAPTDYPSGDGGIEWQARELLENSRATKAPNLGYHLAGTKKVQQALARPGVVERYFSDPSESAALRECFAGLWSLGRDANDDDLSAVRRVLQGQHANFVLKPQREGGGYNFYGDKMLEKLRGLVRLTEDDRLDLDKSLGEYILMERLFPPSQTSILLRGGVVEGSGETVSELGCYGSILVSHDGQQVLHNEYSGFLLRTKFESVDEGGVASGFATLSSPYLV